MSLAFLREGQVEVLSGLNLPMLIKISTCREGRTLKELAKMVKEAGQRNINLASEILQKKP
jgi:PTS system mannose-specific IIA component